MNFFEIWTMKNRNKEFVSVSDSDCDDLNSSNKSGKRQTPKKYKTDSNNEHIEYSDKSQPEVEQVLENVSPRVNSFMETTDLNYCVKSSIFSFEDLTLDDEVYIFQCPNNFIKQSLCNKNIDFTNSKQTITSNNELYELEFLNFEKKFITVAFPKKSHSGSLIVLPLKGHIVLQKVVGIPICEVLDDKDIFKKHKVIFPNDIRVRHPLLGAEWKDHIELANKSLRKGRFIKKKEKKRKKEKDLENRILKPENLKRESSESEIFVPIKKQKNSD